MHGNKEITDLVIAAHEADERAVYELLRSERQNFDCGWDAHDIATKLGGHFTTEHVKLLCGCMGLTPDEHGIYFAHRPDVLTYEEQIAKYRTPLSTKSVTLRVKVKP